MLIALVNQSTAVTDPTAITAIAAAVDYQLVHHASPAFERTVSHCRVYPSLAAVPKGAFPLVILDNADQAGALGYHDETPDGRPYGRIFAKTVLGDGGTVLHGQLSVAAVVSHEALEAFGDVHCNVWADAGSMSIAYELCDPVENDAYEVTTPAGPVSVSNFVLPAWFDAQAPAGTKVDYLGKLSKPFTMTHGGYVITMKDGATSQTFGDLKAVRAAGAAFPEAVAAKNFAAARSARRMAGNEIEFEPDPTLTQENDVSDSQSPATEPVADQPADDQPTEGVRASVTTPRYDVSSAPTAPAVDETP